MPKVGLPIRMLLSLYAEPTTARCTAGSSSSKAAYRPGSSSATPMARPTGQRFRRSCRKYTKVFQMLRGLGFRETESKRALEVVRAQVEVEHANPEPVLRAALAVLTQGACS